VAVGLSPRRTRVARIAADRAPTALTPSSAFQWETMTKRPDCHNCFCVMVVVLLLGATSATQARNLALAAGDRAATTAAQPALVPAQWQTFDILVDFQNLPRTYSCDELWYKFRDVLRKLGARAYTTITPYDCGYLGGGEARSPRVEVKFQMPRLLHGAETRYAEISVIQKSVTLAPGAPRSLGAYDCEFASQLASLFFTALPIRVKMSNFLCSVTPPSWKIVITTQIVAPASTAPAADTPYS
jgi:hypothetical protein